VRVETRIETLRRASRWVETHLLARYGRRAIGNSNAFQNPTRRAALTILRPQAYPRRLVPPKPSIHVNLGRTHAPTSRRDA